MQKMMRWNGIVAIGAAAVLLPWFEKYRLEA